MKMDIIIKNVTGKAENNSYISELSRSGFPIGRKNAYIQHTIWHNGGCNSAESLVKICNVSTRINICVPRNRVKLLSRCRQCRGQHSVFLQHEKKKTQSLKNYVSLRKYFKKWI